ncbi:MAG: A/G-specific adenine glycosylase [Rhodothermaceae bacterium]|nr:A/G-specific adenine glycosylase [Rhodothermaceae bacterium]
MSSETDFGGELLNWYYLNRRDLPWRRSNDPYHIWLSEIMLQQTRVDQVTPYFERFTAAFPTVHDLAGATQQDVMMLWEGLGYYSRARNMHRAARMISEKFGGMMPGTYEEILTLPGVGPYTAAAIASIAHGMPHAVVDGNVIRVLTRYSGMDGDVRTTAVKKAVEALAGELLDRKNPGDYNQALMELGATVCTPRAPDCGSCPLQTGCIAFRSAMTHIIPYKSPKKQIPHYHIAVGIIKNTDGKLLIALRPDNAMLGGLWEFPGGKQKAGESLEETVRRELLEELGIEVVITGFVMKLNHAYSHFRITMHAYHCRIVHGEPRPVASKEIAWVHRGQLADYPFPKANRSITLALMHEQSN